MYPPILNIYFLMAYRGCELYDGFYDLLFGQFPLTFMKAEYFLLIQLEMRLDCLFKV